MNSSADWSGLSDAGDGTKGPATSGPRSGCTASAPDQPPFRVDGTAEGTEPPPETGRFGRGGRRANGEERAPRASARRSATPRSATPRSAAPRSATSRSGDGASDAETKDPEAQARTIVLRQLAGSAKSRKQLEDKLAEKGIPADAACAVLDRFEELQLVDDAAFADAWVRSRFLARGLSRSALRRELREKGIDDELSDAALEQVDGEDELGAARELVERKLRTMPAGLDRDKAVRRLVAMLGRKGHGPGVAYRVADQAWERRRT